MKGFFKCKHPEKYKGNPINIVYRSSYELKAFMQLDHDPNVIKWSSEETIVPYHCPTDGRLHRYFPDLYVEKKTTHGIKCFLYEIKPADQTLPPVQGKNQKRFLNEAFTYAKNVAKWNACKKYCEQRGWEFKILTEKELQIPTYETKR